MTPPFELRPWVPSDCEAIYRIANDPAVRKASFDSEPIPFESHQRWFRKVLDDPERLQYAVVVEGEVVGYVRFDGKVISVALGSSARGAGLGASCIREGVRASGKPHVIAYVMEENEPSVRAFERAGFALMDRERVKNRPALRFEYDRRGTTDEG